MTIKELKELIKDVPDDDEVYFEYDGPDTYTTITAKKVELADGYIVLREK